ncbi:hypothetical protein GCM10007973_17950 [Polymorphobacter multimanifer]|nr:hypothetical protein GCM10007973_17950 [Polymorphobacter multimanifer]
MAHRFRPFPLAVPIGAAHPPALARQAITGADHQHGQFRFAGGSGARIDVIDRLAQGSHVRSAEGVAKGSQGFRIGEWRIAQGCVPKQSFDCIDIEQRIVHAGRNNSRLPT